MASCQLHPLVIMFARTRMHQGDLCPSQPNRENYIIFREYIKCVLSPLTEMMGPTINLISGIHDFCEKREYAFNVLPKYSIIIHQIVHVLSLLLLLRSIIM